MGQQNLYLKSKKYFLLENCSGEEHYNYLKIFYFYYFFMKTVYTITYWITINLLAQSEYW